MCCVPGFENNFNSSGVGEDDVYTIYEEFAINFGNQCDFSHSVFTPRVTLGIYYHR